MNKYLTVRIPYLPIAVLGNKGQTLPVRIVVAVAALQALLEEAAQQLLAVAAHRGPRVRVHLERVRDAQRVRGERAARARHGRRAAALVAAHDLRTNGRVFHKEAFHLTSPNGKKCFTYPNI